ncbi:FAD-dependent oxidoreductase [Pseudonocardia sp. TRM90224]|uniref:FAD-dependent oxidoreductase n=1 Tax=Pseudonocardia sp. TRM90224 TaxID=2812678 RepID=UPI001E44EF4F
MDVQRTRDTDVLVVGGGLVGLTAALLLRHHGLDVTLLEKRERTSAQPKARRLHMRSLEVFREIGLAATVREAARELADHDHMATGRTLAESAQLPLWQPPGGAGETVEVSPELPCLIAQDVLEPVLRDAALAAGADVRFGVEVVGIKQDEDGVFADLGEHGQLLASHAIAADGARSPIREALGITRSGRGAVGEPLVSVYFSADLDDVVRGREFNLCTIEHPDAPGVLVSIGGVRWVFMAGGPVDRDWPRVLRTALGIPAPDLEVHSVLPWQPEMLVADRFGDGRVFLAGDAAHVMPPFAASGANTGIADVHNLAWKLAAAIGGQSGPGLLASYDAERRPAGWFAAEQSTMRADDPGGTGPGHAHPYVLAAGGFQYREGALVGDGVVEPVDDFVPTGRAGTRIPHLWLDDGRSRSTLDESGPGWALAVAGDPDGWTRPELLAYRLVADFLPAGQALLVRPDDIVAWRGDPGDALKVMRRLMSLEQM